MSFLLLSKLLKAVLVHDMLFIYIVIAVLLFFQAIFNLVNELFLGKSVDIDY